MRENNRMPSICHLYLSKSHNFFGHHGAEPGTEPMEEVAEAECVAGSGLRGDRFFDFKADYKGQITFFEWEVWQRLGEELNVPHPPPSVFRRNVIVKGMDLNRLIKKEFTIQGMRFLGTQECAPCHWMDQAFAPGAEEALKGHGGLRAKILSDGMLRVGEA